MCGITGIIGTGHEGKDESIRKMTGAIRHRGPDDDGFYTDERVALGMRRLSIIDLELGKQPIESADGRYIIFFNGEIYNYKELRQELGDYPFKTESDTETILAGYEKWGSEVLGRLRGMFALAIYDKEKGSVLVARDFFGIKPLYYLKDSHRVTAFASEVKSFYFLPDFAPRVNDLAVYNYLSYQYNPLDETFFKGVYKLPPAHFMEVDVETGKARLERYWQFEFKRDEKLGEKEAARRVREVLEDSVSHHMIADVPLGSFLSGGIDSSIIATLAQREKGEEKLKTFTVGFEAVTEALEARDTSSALETDHTEISVGREEYFKALPRAIWHFDEPVADPSALGLYFLSREASKHVKVVLSGEGSDELFGGYNIYLAPLARQKLAWLPKSLLKALINLPLEFRGKNYLRRVSMKLEDWYIGNASIFKPSETKKIWRGEVQERYSLKKLYGEVARESDSAKMQYIDMHTWLVGDILAKADKMTMAHSLELRVPFLDREVADIARTLPDTLKWRGGETKYILREAFRGILPETTRQRKKLGFPTPVRHWFDRDNIESYKTILENSYISERLDKDEIKGYIDDHISGRADNSRKIYTLLALALWYNIFIEGKKP